MLGLSLGCHVFGGTNQVLQILGDLVSHSVSVGAGSLGGGSRFFLHLWIVGFFYGLFLLFLILGIKDFFKSDIALYNESRFLFGYESVF